MREVRPDLSVLRVVLAHGAPGALGEVRTPQAPGRTSFVRRSNPVVFRSLAHERNVRRPRSRGAASGSRALAIRAGLLTRCPEQSRLSTMLKTRMALSIA